MSIESTSLAVCQHSSSSSIKPVGAIQLPVNDDGGGGSVLMFACYTRVLTRATLSSQEPLTVRDGVGAGSAVA